MPRPDLLTFTPKGIYCAKADVYIDPQRPVEKALITHGHADHARGGHKAYLGHEHTVSIMHKRLGKKRNYQGVQYGERIQINGVNFSFVPAGHILGSAQIRVEQGGRIEVVTGDYKLVNDGISGAYEPIRCHKIITECTFGLPVYQWPDQLQVKGRINAWINSNASLGISSVLWGYSLGKAQRLLSLLDTDLPIYMHQAAHDMTQVYRQAGIALPQASVLQEEEQPTCPCVIITPPSGDNQLLNQFEPYRTAFASGWMAVRKGRRMRNMDTSFVLSDHVDWNELQTMIKTCTPEKVVCTHGYTESYAQHLRSTGIEAITEKAELGKNQEE